MTNNWEISKDDKKLRRKELSFQRAIYRWSCASERRGDTVSIHRKRPVASLSVTFQCFYNRLSLALGYLYHFGGENLTADPDVSANLPLACRIVRCCVILALKLDILEKCRSGGLHASRRLNVWLWALVPPLDPMRPPPTPFRPHPHPPPGRALHTPPPKADSP